MDTMYWVFIGFFAITILISIPLLIAVIYFGLNAMYYGEQSPIEIREKDDDKVTPLLGVVHPNKKE